MTILLTAMPSLCDSTDFGLSNKLYNKKQALKFLKRARVLNEIGESVLYLYGDESNGSIFLYDTRQQLITYYIRYRARKSRLNGESVTQTMLWRLLGAPDTEGLAKDVVLKILLKEYPAIMSDRIQTEEGKTFWIGLMGSLLSKGYRVAVSNIPENKIYDIKNHAMLTEWTHGATAWSWNSMQHQGIRFLIYRKDGS